MSIASLVQAAGTSTVSGLDPTFVAFVGAAVAVLVVTVVLVWPSATNRSDEIPSEIDRRQEPPPVPPASKGATTAPSPGKA